MAQATCRDQTFLWYERNSDTKSNLPGTHYLLFACTHPAGDEKQENIASNQPMVKGSHLEACIHLAPSIQTKNKYLSY